MTVETDTQVTTEPSALDAINTMTYPEMLDAWITGSMELAPGTPESDAFNARFQKLRAETPTEELNGTGNTGTNRNRNGKNKKKAGRNHGNRR